MKAQANTPITALYLLLVGFAAPVMASEPASHEVTVPTVAGDTVVVEWTGTALAGSSGSGNMCPPAGPDDSHDIILSVPEGLYDSVNVSAHFHIEWEPGEPDPAGLVTDPDLVLSVIRDGFSEGDSDGGSPEENVTLSNPAAGTLTAVVCPFLASDLTEYRGRLTLTALGEASCVVPPSGAKAHAVSDSGARPPRNPEARGLPNFDQLRDSAEIQLSALPKADFAGRHQSALFDRKLGRTTFLWAKTDAEAAAVGPLASETERLAALARAQLRSEAGHLNLSDDMIANARVADAQYNGNGPAVVKLRQQHQGIEVFERSLQVLIDRQDRPVAVSGYFADVGNPVAHADSLIDAPQAIATAWGSLGGQLNANLLNPQRIQGDYTWYQAPLLTGSHVFERNPRARPVWYAGVDGLQPAWHLELFATARINGQLIAYSFVIAAADGQVLNRKNLIQDAAFSYRVFADDQGAVQPFDSPFGNEYAPFTGATPTEQLPRVSANTRLVTIESGPISTGDPWLADGATITVGNNTEACLDRVDNPASGLISNPANTCDPELGDEYGATNGASSFDYPIDGTGDPADPDFAQAAVVNLFYVVNWLHDWWYDHGFNEAAGNAQADNYGRGGADGDPIRAQGQDASGRNNANMATPGDGSSPTMQQYLFDGPVSGDVRQLTPSDSGALKFSGAGFGPGTFDVTGAVVLADDGTGVSSTDGCGEDLGGQATAPPPPQTSLSGNIALIDRGGCNFTTKAQFAVNSGAIAMVVVNNTDGEPITMGNGDVPVDGVPVSPTDAAYDVPSVMIRRADGQSIKDALAGGATMHVQRNPTIDSDGTLDNQIIAHEFYHYTHNRLADVSNQQSRAMGEGWGDISALMLSVRASDTQIPGNDRYQGAYGLAGYVVDNFYSGIRRAPYSTDMKLNAFTLKHIADGEPTPDGGNGASNSQVHSSGEIWSNMLWECYTGLLNDPRHSFDEARNRMKDYLIGGLKMTPGSATYTEARDAVLSVALANDFQDYAVCSAGFAKRGNGLNAVAPDRSSADHVGVAEDFSPFICGSVASLGSPGTSGGGTVVNNQRFGGGALSASLLWLLLSLALGGRALTRRRAR